MDHETLCLIVSDRSRRTYVNISPDRYVRERIETDSCSTSRLTNKVEFGYYYACEKGSGIVGGNYVAADELQRLVDTIRSFVSKKNGPCFLYRPYCRQQERGGR